ncbi:MAG: PEGA domain-containing protein [Deltaproteobacteria bacterium]|nr:PEGA domain-containing protein [Deltaproteobacteria bacterium]
MTALLLASLLAAAPTYAPANVDAAGTPDVLHRIHAAASRALVQVGDDPNWAGVVISESGIIATSSHGLEGKVSASVTFTNGYRASAQVVWVDQELGVALLEASGLPAMAYLQVSPLPVQATQAAYAVYLPKPLAPAVTFARVTSTNVSRAGRIDDRFFTARFGMIPRARGGPVVSYAGQLLGLVLTSDAGGTGFALSSRALLELVGAHNNALPTSSLTVTSDPSGAQVLLDGAPVGKTPASLQTVAAGEHALTLKSPGLPDVLKRVVSLGPSHQDVAATLFAGAAVHLDAPAGARVYVDGIWRAVGASTLFLSGGRHQVQATLPGRRAFARQIEVVEDRPLTLVAEMPELHATLSVDSVPPGAEVMLDDNRVGATPLNQVRVTPGTYEVTLAHPGFHTLKRAVTIPDGQEVNLGKLTLEAPHAIVIAHVPTQTTVSIDGGPRHVVKAQEDVPPGTHQLVFYAPYQYAEPVNLHAEDGQTVPITPLFVAAGNPHTAEVTHTVSNIVEGGAGVLTLVSTLFFLAAEDNRSNNEGQLTASGHSNVQTGLITGGIGLGLYAASVFIDSLQPTPDMGFDHTASGARVPAPTATTVERK